LSCGSTIGGGDSELELIFAPDDFYNAHLEGTYETKETVHYYILTLDISMEEGRQLLPEKVKWKLEIYVPNNRDAFDEQELSIFLFRGMHQARLVATTERFPYKKWYFPAISNAFFEEDHLLVMWRVRDKTEHNFHGSIKYAYSRFFKIPDYVKEDPLLTHETTIIEEGETYPLSEEEEHSE